jgi:hypothetical protein
MSHRLYINRLYNLPRWACIFILCINTYSTIYSQSPFINTRQIFISKYKENKYGELAPSTLSGTLDLKNEFSTSVPIDAIGYNGKLKLLFAINYKQELIVLGANGTSKITPNLLDKKYNYLAGDVTPDGSKYIAIASDTMTRKDVAIVQIDITTTTYTTSYIPFNGDHLLSDIAIDPRTSKVFGYDQTSGSLLDINVTNGSISTIGTLDKQNSIEGLYFDALGNLFGYGNTVFGIVDAIFNINKNTGKEKVSSTGPRFDGNDAASCAPYGIDMKVTTEPKSTLPCSHITAEFLIANNATHNLSSTWSVTLPLGIKMVEVIGNANGATVDTLGSPQTITIKNLKLTQTFTTFKFKFYVADIPKQTYKFQAFLNGLPVEYGQIVASDDISTPGLDDYSTTEVNRYEVDSLDYEWFVCHGEKLLLDASDFGNNIEWNTGSKENLYYVGKAGSYKLKVKSGCEDLTITHNVSAAACPYIISVAFDIKPDTIFPCSDTKFYFILNNQSGEVRKNLNFSFPIRPEMKVNKVLKNKYGGKLNTSRPNVISFDSLTLHQGTDTIILEVQVKDIIPSTYKSLGTLSGLPRLMGPIRVSDDPGTLLIDSTALVVLGSLQDTLLLDTVICPNNAIMLDASPYGKNVAWSDGNTQRKISINKSGIYTVKILDGCTPRHVHWNVSDGQAIKISNDASLIVHQGEQIILLPKINNQGLTQAIKWHSNKNSTLSCTLCEATAFSSLDDAIITLFASNESCVDSQQIFITIDKSRRIFTPNVVSANGDDMNDHFTIHSPDFALIKKFDLYDRWGNKLLQATDISLNADDAQLNFSSYKLNPDLYTWIASIEFVDGSVEKFSGTVLVVR